VVEVDSWFSEEGNRMKLELVSRNLDEMTSREVELYFQAGGDLVFVPFGPISGHGALIPLGIHAHWAQALSLLLAERANGLVYPPIFTVYSGATRSFRGAVSFPITEQVAILTRVASTLYAQGFKRTVLVAGTSPENYGGTVAARELFDKTEHPFWLIIGENVLSAPEVKAITEGYPGNFGETQIDAASLKILGRARPIPCAKWAKELKKDDDGDQPAEIASDVVTLRRTGTIGWRYHEEKNHGNHGNVGLTFKGKSDIDLAVEVLEKCADLLVPRLGCLDRYLAWLEKHPFQYIVPTDRLDEK
jgi:hypothetical protein